MLGVTLQSDLRMTTHVDNILTKASQTTYALKLVKSHGLPTRYLDIITNSTLFSGLSYASPAWIGFTSAEDLKRLQAVTARAHRWGLTSKSVPVDYQGMCDKADMTLFSKVVSMGGHVLHSMLPAHQTRTYNLRPRAHSFILPATSQSLKRNFFHRMLYKLANVVSLSERQ